MLQRRANGRGGFWERANGRGPMGEVAFASCPGILEAIDSRASGGETGSKGFILTFPGLVNIALSLCA